MRRCKTCGNSMRKGTIALVAGEDGKLKGATVCTRCAQRGVLIVPVNAAPACSCGALASKCGSCSEKEADKAKRGAADAEKLAAEIEKRVKAYDGSHPGMRGLAPLSDEAAGIAIGLEMAANFLRSGAW